MRSAVALVMSLLAWADNSKSPLSGLSLLRSISLEQISGHAGDREFVDCAPSYERSAGVLDRLGGRRHAAAAAFGADAACRRHRIAIRVSR